MVDRFGTDFGTDVILAFGFSHRIELYKALIDLGQRQMLVIASRSVQVIVLLHELGVCPVTLVHHLFPARTVHSCIPVLRWVCRSSQEVSILVELLTRRRIHSLVVLELGAHGCRWLHMQMRSFELFGTLGPK